MVTTTSFSAKPNKQNCTMLFWLTYCNFWIYKMTRKSGRNLRFVLKQRPSMLFLPFHCVHSLVGGCIKRYKHTLLITSFIFLTCCITWQASKNLAIHFLVRSPGTNELSFAMLLAICLCSNSFFSSSLLCSILFKF